MRTSATTTPWHSRKHETMLIINKIFLSSIFSVTMGSNQETWVSYRIMVKASNLKTVCATLISFYNKMQPIYSMSKATSSPATSILITVRVAGIATETKKMKMALT